MMKFSLDPPRTTIPATHRNDPRLGHWINFGDPRSAGSGCRPSAVLLGFPCDLGVVRNGGRKGAAEAPAEIRRFLHRLTPPAGIGGFETFARGVWDLGNLALTPDLEENQALLGEACAPWLEMGCPLIVLGGGHETTYGHFLGYVRAGLEVEILNWDAHADVRELRDGLGHSGSPFRQALNHPDGRCRSYHLAGWLPHCNASEHLALVWERGGKCLEAGSLDESQVRSLYQESRFPLLVSFDLDVVDQAFAPGVSAPASGGLQPSLWLSAVRRAGQCPALLSADFVEVNPALDRDGQTSRLAALGVWNLLAGLAER